MNQNGADRSFGKEEEEEYTSTQDHMEALFEKAGDYAETRLRLFQLKSIDKISELAASAISGLLLAVVFLFFIGLLNIAIALFIGSRLGNAYWGFFVLSGCYLLIWFIFRMGNNKWFKTPITNRIIKKFF